jgi:hypothetical protein
MPLSDLPPFECLQNIFNYAAPVLVGMESIAIRMDTSHLNETWLHVLRTTRTLLAHCTLMSGHQEHFLQIAATNIRNLYRLYGIDMADKEHWEIIDSNTSYYIPATDDGQHWVPSDYCNMVGAMRPVEFSVMNNEFEMTQHKIAKNTLGNCIYNLVATCDTGWKKSMRPYKIVL